MIALPTPLVRGVLLAALLGTAQARADTTVKIGNILALTGDGAAIGQQIQRGEALFQKLHDKDLPPGTHVELITRDDASKPDNTKRLAQELIVRDHVQMLAGITLSPQGFVVGPIATEAKIPTVLMNATTGSITRASPYIVRFSQSNWHGAYTIGAYAAKHGIKTAYAVVADYAAGLDMEAAFSRGFTDNGGTMVGADHTPLSTTDYLPYLQRVKAAKPQGLFFFEIAGAATLAFAKAYGDANLAADHIQLVGTGDVVPDDQLPQTGPIMAGMWTGAVYSNALTSPANEAFLAAWHAEYGADSRPNYSAVGGWNGMGAIYSVVKQLGANATGDAAMALFKSYKVDDSPQGPIAIDPETRDIVCDVHLGKISKVGDRWEDPQFDIIKAVKDPWKVLNPPS
jgi:branched-chain amino acid transport system substrate-binding protein